jgi:hypothetical protein
MRRRDRAGEHLRGEDARGEHDGKESEEENQNDEEPNKDKQESAVIATAMVRAWACSPKYSCQASAT